MTRSPITRLSPILATYDALLIDIDGTMYRGSKPIAGAGQVVSLARSDGMVVRFVTNNSSRSPADVSARLHRVGVPATDAEIHTSAQVAAKLAADLVPAESRALVVGTRYLVEEVRNAGLTPVANASADAAVVVQGFSPDIGWRELAEACVALDAGARWVACNTDVSIPTERGTLPGNGSLVSVVQQVTGRTPIVAGKPAREAFHAVVRQSSARRPLVVGDRLDTDVAGATTAGFDALLVLSGIATPGSLIATGPLSRPRYVSPDISALLSDAQNLEIAPHPGWDVHVVDDVVRLRRCRSAQVDSLSALRAICAAWWQAGIGQPTFEAADHVAEAALRQLDLGSSSDRKATA